MQMQLPDNLRERLVSELKTAIMLMRQSESLREKLLYFSVTYLEVGRIINWQWDADLVLIWLVTQQVHQRATPKLQSMLQGDRLAPLPDDYFEHLIQATSDLADYIETNGSSDVLAELMGRFSMLAYLTTGNGFYLTQKTALTTEDSPA